MYPVTCPLASSGQEQVEDVPPRCLHGHWSRSMCSAILGIPREKGLSYLCLTQHIKEIFLSMKTQNSAQINPIPPPRESQPHVVMHNRFSTPHFPIPHIFNSLLPIYEIMPLTRQRANANRQRFLLIGCSSQEIRGSLSLRLPPPLNLRWYCPGK